MEQAIRFDSGKFNPAEAKAWCKEHGKDYISFEKATGSTTAASFAFEAPRSPWLQVADVEDSQGVRVRRFHKELIKCGTYIKEDDTAFTVTPDTLTHWVAVTSQMRMNGVRIPLSNSPTPHQDTTNPRNSVGELTGVFVRDDGLVGIVEIVGDDMVEQALANDVSIFSPVESSDAKGNVYLRPITHVALTPAPVIQGLKGWEPVAASRAPADTGDKEMKNLKEIAAALGVSKEDAEKWSDDNASEMILKAIKAFVASQKKAGEDAVKAAREEAKKAAEAAVKAAQDKADADKGDAKPVEPDPVLLSLARTNRELCLSQLVSAGRILPAVAAKLGAMFVEDGALRLSIDAAGVKRFDDLVAALAENDPVELGEKTRAQLAAGTLPLSRSTDDKSLVENARKRRERAEKKGAVRT